MNVVLSWAIVGGMNPFGTRSRLLHRLDAAWREFKESYAGLEEAQMRQRAAGDWSVLDIIAHVTTWEEEALRHLPAILEGRRTPRYSQAYGGVDAFNAASRERKRGLSLPEVLRQLDRTHARLLAMLQDVPEEQLRGETRARRRLRLDTYGHYALHAKAIREWRLLSVAVGPLDEKAGCT